ncbi:MAG TPA: protein kinase, partial [Myxococcota bacterium]|nr:protein kinase [Myxococcota bacterium]
MSLVGTRLGKYELAAEIGHGGMSVVYRAHDTQLKRDVAVKVMHAFMAEQPEARERFHREAVAVARLRHPNIIEIFDYSGEKASTSYIVMELVDGTALADAVRDRPLSCPEAALILARPIADALDSAHKGGVVHRDLKPENILLGRHGELKLTDFGIARILDNQAMTMTGTLLGSPAYMAPEYIEGYATDERADIFSFGAMLYYLVVGRLPFEAPSPHALLKRIAAGEYPLPQQNNPQTHAAISRIIVRCLKRLPEQRYATAGELRDAIDTHLRALGLDWEQELPKLLADSREHCEDLENRVTARCTELGKEALERGQHGVAMEHFDRVLASKPHDAEVRKLLRRLGRRVSLIKAVRAGAVATVVAMMLGGAAYGAMTWKAGQDARRSLADSRTTDAESREVIAESRPPIADSRPPETTTTDARPTAIPDRVPPTKTTPTKQPPVTSAANPPAGTTPDKPADPTPPKPTPVRPVRFNAVNVVTAYVDDSGEPVVRDRIGPFSLDLAHGTHRLRFTNPLAYESEMNLMVDDVSPA